jgi:predicted enzyme related to lactoylglutathione lyase
VVELLGWDASLYLLDKPAGTIGAGSDRRRYERHWTPLHLDIVVEDVNVALSSALAAGAALENGPQETPYGRIAMLADPFGHGLCLIQFNVHGYDALADVPNRRLVGPSKEESNG